MRLYYVSLLFGSAIPTSFLIFIKIIFTLLLHCRLSTALRIVEVQWARTRLRELRHTHNVTWYSTSAMASNVGTVLETPASTELNHNGMNILVVKGIAHTRWKEICAKATVIALASFDIHHLKKSLKEEEEER